MLWVLEKLCFILHCNCLQIQCNLFDHKSVKKSNGMILREMKFYFLDTLCLFLFSHPTIAFINIPIYEIKISHPN